jgi:hypothetical protein
MPPVPNGIGYWPRPSIITIDLFDLTQERLGEIAGPFLVTVDSD